MTTWNTGDIITAEKMNKIENNIENLHDCYNFQKVEEVIYEYDENYIALKYNIEDTDYITYNMIKQLIDNYHILPAISNSIFFYKMFYSQYIYRVYFIDIKNLTQIIEFKNYENDPNGALFRQE